MPDGLSLPRVARAKAFMDLGEASKLIGIILFSELSEEERIRWISEMDYIIGHETGREVPVIWPGLYGTWKDL